MQPLRHFDFAELERFAARFDEATMNAWLEALVARHQCREFVQPGYELPLARRIRELVEAGRPASCLRVGDGEGNILGASDREFRNLAKLSAQKAAEMHLGRWFPARVLESWSRATLQAVDEADVIGLPGPGRIRKLYRSLKDAERDRSFDIRGACGTINALRHAYGVLSGASAGRTITDSMFHHGLLPHYRDILRDAPRIGLISCYTALPEKLSAAFGVGHVDLFLIPGQISNIGRNPAKPHYPDVFEEVMETLCALQPGQPVLVAAGILGKIYCNRIKQCGGIALDIGSVADVWMGKRARRYHHAAYLEKWKLA